MVLYDGWNAPVTFTFSNAAAAVTDIDITGAVTAAAMRDRIVDAITATALVQDLEFVATTSGAAQVTITTYRYGTRGNQTQTETVTNVGFVLANTTGGLDGWVLTDSTYASFGINDVGKVLLTVDAANVNNNGVWMILRCISANAVELDFYADPNNGEAFVSASGLTWYMWEATSVPQTNGDIGRLDSQHSTGWAIEIERHATVANAMFRVAVDGDWAGSKILGQKGLGFLSAGDPDGGIISAEVETSGLYLNLWTSEIADASVNNSIPNGLIITNLTTVEAGKLDIEKVCLLGVATISPIAKDMVRFGTDVLGRGQLWNEVIGEVVVTALVEPSYYNSADGFTDLINREGNSRLATRTASGLLPWDVAPSEVFSSSSEVFSSSLVIQDYDNASPTGLYEIVGWTQGHLVSRRFEHFDDAAPDATDPRRRNILLTQTNPGDKIHPWGGFVFGWP